MKLRPIFVLVMAMLFISYSAPAQNAKQELNDRDVGGGAQG